MTIQAPAKVNLVLRILSKRPDGFHDIETLMAPVSLADEIEITVAPGAGVDLQCDRADIPAGPGNLVWRAVEAFIEQTGLEFHARIQLKKNIPHGAGLGGGSSDAAAVLKALDGLLETRLGFERLEKVAATLGADVPFFIRCRPALCRGRGEILEDAGTLPASRLLLLKPPFPVPTAWAYQAWSSNHPQAETESPFQKLGEIRLRNDLEQPVFEKYLLLPTIKSWLLEQEEVSAAMMSGSGSTVFAVLRPNSGTLVQRAKARFGPQLWTAETTL